MYIVPYCISYRWPFLQRWHGSRGQGRWQSSWWRPKYSSPSILCQSCCSCSRPCLSTSTLTGPAKLRSCCRGGCRLCLAGRGCKLGSSDREVLCITTSIYCLFMDDWKSHDKMGYLAVEKVTPSEKEDLESERTREKFRLNLWFNSLTIVCIVWNLPGECFMSC